MRVRQVSFKLGTMRKPVDWVVYPEHRAGSFIVQSDHRIASLDPATGKGMLSKHCPSGAYFPHLISVLGATEIDVPADIIELVRAAQPKSGDEIGPGVYVA